MSNHDYYPDIYIPPSLLSVGFIDRIPKLPPIFYVNLISLLIGSCVFALIGQTAVSAILAVVTFIFTAFKLISYVQERKDYRRRKQMLPSILRQRLLDKLKSTKPHDRLKNASKGASEAGFYQVLNEHFPNKIFIECAIDIPNFHEPYTADFTYHDRSTGLRIDIEIDEPYYYDKDDQEFKPYHCLGFTKEIRRNQLFLDYGWLVIRFAEEQVILHPKSCCKEIAITIAQLLKTKLDPKWQSIPNLEKVKRWTEADSKNMIQHRYRDQYASRARKFS